MSDAGIKTNRCGARVVCIGETMLMFAPPRTETIEYYPTFTCFHGGSESNVAIGLERLGIHAAWIGKLPNNALGRKVVNEVRGLGADCSAVVWSETGRLGTFFFEWGAPPRPLTTIYDRANSAATTLTCDELDWDYIAGCEWLHLTGITPATSETCRQTTLDMAVRAKELGLKICFDVNYRSLLWTPEQARDCCRQILPYIDLLVATEPDAAILLGKKLERQAVLDAFWAMGDLEAVVITLGGEGSIAYDGQKRYRSYGYEVQTVNRLGAGDSFVSGLLYGYLNGSLQDGIDYGSAFSALKMTIPQNIPLVNKADMLALIAGRSKTDVLR